MPEDTLTVGVLSPLLAGAYFGAILKGVARQVATAGGRVVAVQTRDARMGETVVWPAASESVPLAWDRVTGFISVINAVSDGYLRQVRAHGKPLVRISGHSPAIVCPEVVPDNRQGIADAVGHLVAHGHTRIGFAGQMARPAGDDVHERHRAYRQAMLSHGLQPSVPWLFPAPENLAEGGNAVATAMLGAGMPCTAVVAATDIIALGILTALRQAGVDVPEQVAVTGFDDREFAPGTSPSLSSVRVDFEHVGHQAARLLLAGIAGEDVPAGAHRVATTFVARQSCGCPGLPVASAEGRPLGGADERLRTDLATILAAAGGDDVLARADRAAAEMTGCFRRAAESLQTDNATVARAAEAMYSLFPRAATVSAVMERAQQYRRDLLREEGYSDEKLLALDECALLLSSALNTINTRRHVEVNRSLQDLLREEHNVSLSLVSQAQDTSAPGDLTWLADTHARTACLALWSGAGPDSGQGAELKVAGVFGPGMQRRLTLGEKLLARSFPPITALTSQGCGPEDIVMVLPVRTPKRYWGVLAVTGQTESVSWAGADVYFQWTALLAMTLDREALLEEVRASEERYVLASEAANDGLWDWDIPSGTVFYSPRWKSMLGYSEAEVGQAPSELFARVHPDDHDEVEQLVGACLRGERKGFQLEIRAQAKDGQYRWVLCRAIAVGGPGRRPARMVGAITDIGERKELEAQLRRAALYDALTGLPNRSLFMDHMAQAFARAKRAPGYQFCVLFIDLDGFKAVNDGWGHSMGDALLAKVAARLKAQLRDNDTAVRFGGDEFAILVDGIGGDEPAAAIVERLRKKLSLPYQIDGHHVRVSATIGVASSTSGYDTPDDMVREADAAMYRAKKADRQGGVGPRALTPAPPPSLADVVATFRP